MFWLIDPEYYDQTVVGVRSYYEKNKDNANFSQITAKENVFNPLPLYDESDGEDPEDENSIPESQKSIEDEFSQLSIKEDDEDLEDVSLSEAKKRKISYYDYFENSPPASKKLKSTSKPKSKYVDSQVGEPDCSLSKRRKFSRMASSSRESLDIFAQTFSQSPPQRSSRIKAKESLNYYEQTSPLLTSSSSKSVTKSSGKISVNKPQNSSSSKSRNNNSGRKSLRKSLVEEYEPEVNDFYTQKFSKKSHQKLH